MSTSTSIEPDNVSLVRARLRDFFDVHAPWQRRLWDCGTLLGLRELSDAVEWVERASLSAGALKWLSNDLERLQGPDRGIGNKVVRAQLQNALRSPLKHGNAHHRLLNEIIDWIEDGYLARWKAAASTPGASLSPERFARAVASHLLDAGFSQDFLHSWVARLNVQTLAEIADAASELLESHALRSFEVLVPFEAVSNDESNRDENDAWRPARFVNSWLKENRTSFDGRIAGGFLYVVTARDQISAAEEAREIVDRLKARATYSRRTTNLRDFGLLVVKGEASALPLQRPVRGGFVLSLVREKRLYAVSERTPLDNALELAAPMNHGSIATAISGGWSAVEALLLRGDDASPEGRGVMAADRMAALTACSWPRAELTTLAYAHKPEAQDRLLREITGVAGASENREKARLVEKWIRSGHRLTLKSSSDTASEERVRNLLNNPAGNLGQVKRHMTSAMRRLYRHRNIVMHGGATHLNTLSMTLRTVTPLIGAGLDRIAHASIVSESSPLELASRAELRLNLLRAGDDAPSLVDLLE